MKAIKTKNTMKQLIRFFSMLLFLFTACNLYSQQVAGIDPADMPANNTDGAAIVIMPVSKLSSEVLNSIPVKYNRNTLYSYSIQKKMDVEIKLYNKDGVEFKTLVCEAQNAGTHIIDFQSVGLKDGIYFYQLTVGTFSEIKKIILAN